MQLHNNVAVIAAAGSRKTQHIVDCVLSDPSRRVLVTTYTNENLRQLVGRMSMESGVMPSHVTAMGWFTFLLNQCARPYQSSVLGEVGFVRGLNFVGGIPRGIPKSRARKYYFDKRRDMYRDGVSDFSYEANRITKGAVVDRLAAMYDHIYIDEMQDMVGYDLEIIDLLLRSPIGITMVGDPRQFTFSTNDSSKNRKYRGMGMLDWLSELNKKSERCVIETRAESYRCNQAICDFSDALFPELAGTTSKNLEITGHDGIFDIKPDEVSKYIEQYNPVILRHDRNTKTQGFGGMNVGVSKGSTFDRVLIFPTKPEINCYRANDYTQLKDKSRSSLYVAVTRAKYSTTFVIP